MHPTAVERTPETFLWADVLPLHGENGHSPNGHNKSVIQTKARNRAHDTSAAEIIRQPQTQGQPYNGPIQFGATVADHMVQVSYNAQHKIPWHWPVPAYLVTKGLAAGLFLILSFGWLFKWFRFDGAVAVTGGIITLAFMLATTGLLVIDLEKPERFLYILLRPQWKSWLARGAIFLVGFSTLASFWWLFELGSFLFDYEVPVVQNIFLVLGIPLAIGVAIYTAFLFAQSEGRDLWQSPLLPMHLIVQALMMGGGMLLLMDWFLDMNDDIRGTAVIIFAVALIVDLFITLFGEFGIPHASEVAAAAAHEISHGRYKNQFWYGSIVAGHILPLLLLIAGNPLLSGFAALLAAGGLYLYEYAFVMAPQEVPNS
jgi:formate-dependent nitrite reductase membrane component NrfD